jgi:putative transposon-encoded protein
MKTIKVEREEVIIKGLLYRKEVKPFGAGSGYIPFHKRYISREVYIVVPKDDD